MELNQLLWSPYDTYGLKVRILYTQQKDSFVVEGTFMKFCLGCISNELTLHLPWKVHCYNYVAS